MQEYSCFCTVHGNDLEDVKKKRAILGDMIKNGVFHSIVVLSAKRVGEIKTIYNKNLEIVYKSIRRKNNMFLQLVGALIVMLSCTIAGICFGKKINYRIEELEQMQSAMTMLQNQIHFLATPCQKRWKK